MISRIWRVVIDPIVLACLAAVLGLAIALNAQPRYPVVRDDRVDRTFAFAGVGDRRLEVSTISGAIHLVAHDGDSLEVSVVRTIHSETDADASAAESAATVQFHESDGAVRVHGDAALKPGCDQESNTRNRRRSRYWVAFDFEIRVPRDASVRLCTINGGEIRVEGLSGRFDISNVNGGITLVDARGTGRAVTVNGDVQGSFAEEPRDTLLFKSVNGDLEAAFPPDLAADLWMKTFNGGLYTDFDVASLPSTVTAERRNGRFVYRSNRLGGFRVGGGGPALTFDAFNGDVRILSRR